MAGPNVEALAAQLRADGQGDLACKLVHAAEVDEHEAGRHVVPVEGCLICHAEYDETPHGGTIHQKLRL